MLPPKISILATDSSILYFAHKKPPAISIFFSIAGEFIKKVVTPPKSHYVRLRNTLFIL
jgi:hypothetical protein